MFHDLLAKVKCTLENKTNKYFALMRSKDAKWCWYFHDSLSIDLHYLVDDCR